MKSGTEPLPGPGTDESAPGSWQDRGDAVLVPRLIALAVVGGLLLVPPLLRLWEGSVLALFGVWAALIAVLAWLMERDAG